MKELETSFHRGVKGSPLAVFIHGMGMKVTVWTDPKEARMLGGKYPLTALLGDKYRDLTTSFQDVRDLGWHVLSWSQTRPAGPIRIAVQELKELIGKYRRYTESGIVFICHSRGGLIARKYIEEDPSMLRALITLATPHRGTSMAQWATFISPLTAALDKVLKGVSRREADSAFRRILAFINSSGVRELLPDSSFIATLRDAKKDDARYLSLGGTHPDLLRAVSPMLQELLSGAVPGRLLPDEMKEGLGDGLVSASSSVLPYGNQHLNYPDNHAAIIFDQSVREYILKGLLA